MIISIYTDFHSQILMNLKHFYMLDQDNNLSAEEINSTPEDSNSESQVSENSENEISKDEMPIIKKLKASREIKLLENKAIEEIKSEYKTDIYQFHLKLQYFVSVFVPR